MRAPDQLPLRLAWDAGCRFEGFVPGPNTAAVAALEAAAAGGGEACLYLWGGAGLGKSHLLQAACARAAETGRRPAYLPLGAAGEWETTVLEGLEALDLVCLDDVQAVAGRRPWEEALFALFNRLRSAGTTLVAAGAAAPAALGLALADLRSRLAWGPVFHLRPLAEAERAAALARLARRRGLELPPEVGRFLLRRCPRDMASLVALLDRLDEASLAEQRRLTVPFVRRFL